MDKGVAGWDADAVMTWHGISVQALHQFTKYVVSRGAARAPAFLRQQPVRQGRGGEDHLEAPGLRQRGDHLQPVQSFLLWGRLTIRSGRRWALKWKKGSLPNAAGLPDQVLRRKNPIEQSHRTMTWRKVLLAEGPNGRYACRSICIRMISTHRLALRGFLPSV